MQQRCWFHLTPPNYASFLKMTIHTLPFLPNCHLSLPLSLLLKHPHSHSAQLVLLAKSPAPSCLTLGFLAFSVDVDQTPVKYWTSHSIQSSFLLLFIYFSFSSRYSVLGFPFCCVCILCTWSARKVWMVTRFPLAEIYYFLMLRNWLWPYMEIQTVSWKCFSAFCWGFFKLAVHSCYKEVWNLQQP